MNLTEETTMKKNKISKYAPKRIFAQAAEKVQDRAERIQESAQNVWLAGLGALTTAEDEGGKLFRSLVKKGEALDSKNKKVFSAMMKDVEARVEVAKETVVDATSGTVNKIEAGLESGMATVMHTLGVPTRNEIKSLTKKVDALTDSVERKAKAARRATVKKVKKVGRAVNSAAQSL